MSTANYQAIQIKNEFLSFLGVNYDATAKAVMLDKALAQAWVEVQTKWNVISTNSPVFSILWRDFACYRMAMITDGPGSARAENLLAEFKASVAIFGDIGKTLDGSAVLFPPWMAGLNVTAGDIWTPSTGAGTLAFLCTTAGVTSTTTEPAMPALNATVTDGTAVWQAITMPTASTVAAASTEGS